MRSVVHGAEVRTGAAMDKKPGDGPQDGPKAQGVWERGTQDRRWGQNQPV